MFAVRMQAAQHFDMQAYTGLGGAAWRFFLEYLAELKGVFSMTIETPPSRRCRARVGGVLSIERMRKTLVIILIVLAVVVITGFIPLSIRKYPSLAVSVGFVGYTTNTLGSRFVRFGITNGCTFPVRRLGCYNAYERRPLDPGAEQGALGGRQALREGPVVSGHHPRVTRAGGQLGGVIAATTALTSAASKPCLVSDPVSAAGPCRQSTSPADGTT